MAVNWKINGVKLEDLGLSVVACSMRVQAVSSVTLELGCDFDAAQLFTEREPVTLSRVEDGVTIPYFTGQVTSVPKHGDGASEGHQYVIEDAWAQLETTVYQETWGLGTSSVMLPRAVLGLGLIGADYERITVGAQVKNILTYAIGQGVNLQLGSFPTGELMIPAEIENQMCAELIQTVLKLHPDWIPWIDHATATPTINVTPVAEMTPRSFPVDGSVEVESFECVKRDDLIPSGVRVIYEFATTIEDEVYRNVKIDKYPAGAPDGGPRLIQATIPLAGMSMQIQKSQVQARKLPATNEELHDYLKLKFPQLASLPDAGWAATGLVRKVITDEEEQAPQISGQASRLKGTTLAHLPNELVRGNVAEWMRRKVGKVHLKFNLLLTPGATPPSAAQKKDFDSVPKDKDGNCGLTVVATNAITKTYKGISQWVAADDVPSGVAQDVYDAILNGILYQGSVTITAKNLPALPFLGNKVNLTGGDAEWATMIAAVHSTDWDVDSGKITISFGPAPHLAPQDFIELQRILRFRPATWWSIGERKSNRLGADQKPSAQGDTITPYDVPETTFDSPPVEDNSQFATTLAKVEGAWKATVKPGYVHFLNPKKDASPVSKYWMPTGMEDSPAPTHSVTVADALFCKVVTETHGVPTAVTIEKDVKGKVSKFNKPGSDALDGEFYYKIAEFEMVGDDLVAKPFQSGGPIFHVAQPRGDTFILEVWNGGIASYGGGPGEEGAVKYEADLEPINKIYFLRGVAHLDTKPDGYPADEDVTIVRVSWVHPEVGGPDYVTPP